MLARKKLAKILFLSRCSHNIKTAAATIIIVVVGTGKTAVGRPRFVRSIDGARRAGGEASVMRQQAHALSARVRCGR